MPRSSRWYALAVLLMVVWGAVAHSEDEKTVALREMQRAIVVIDEMSPWVEDIDLARLRLIRHRAQAVLDAIGRYGLAHHRTMLEYEHFDIAFEYSTAFFKQIALLEITGQIQELRDIHQQVVDERGLDKSPYSLIIADTFTQIHQLVKQLLAVSDLPADLRKDLEALAKPLGDTISIAGQGDRPKAFAEGDRAYHKIVALYPELNAVEHSNAVFDIVLDIEGLNEFYAEFAQHEK